MFKHLIPLALFAISTPVLAGPLATSPATATALQQSVEATLASAPTGTRFGLLIIDDQGREVVAINPDQRFIPASNTKMFTTAAAFALLAGMDQPDAAGGAQVWLEGGHGGNSVVLHGRGDARMSSAPDCTVNCLATLADAVAARTRRVHDVIGDDSLWADQRWVPGMSWNNIGTVSGTAVSALNLDNNELRVSVTPAAVGMRPTVEASPYYTVRNEAMTTPAGTRLALVIERPVNGTVLRVFGQIPEGARAWSERIGVDDPAHFAAWNLKALLEARGVKVAGQVRVRHRAPALSDRPSVSEPAAIGPVTRPPLASLIPPPLAEDVATINKDSQNLHAQALFRRLAGDAGSEQWSAANIRALFETVGIPSRGFDFSDGAGMSTYNRVSPRATIALLRWIDTQPWRDTWQRSLPIAGRDGTLKRRFVGTALEGNLTAKTGTLNATNALSGTLRAGSGRNLAFAFFANDVPEGTSVIALMEAALVQVAAAN